LELLMAALLLLGWIGSIGPFQVLLAAPRLQ
jgi:hypothetical protein